MFNTTNALVLREVRYKEADRILTLLTSTDGKITAKARGALRKNSRTAAATQQLTYSEMTLFGNRGKWTVNEAAVRESFGGLRADLEKFALGSYFAECLEAVSVEDQPDPALLQLGLNSLYALSRELCGMEQIKAVFEMRLMCLAGYTPALMSCCVCGKEEPDRPVLSLGQGAVCCRECAGYEDANAPLCEGSLKALRYIVEANPKQIFSFSIADDARERLAGAAERYLLMHMERRFATLEYWKQIRIK